MCQGMISVEYYMELFTMLCVKQNVHFTLATWNDVNEGYMLQLQLQMDGHKIIEPSQTIYTSGFELMVVNWAEKNR